MKHMIFPRAHTYIHRQCHTCHHEALIVFIGRLGIIASRECPRVLAYTLPECCYFSITISVPVYLIYLTVAFIGPRVRILRTYNGCLCGWFCRHFTISCLNKYIIVKLVAPVMTSVVSEWMGKDDAILSCCGLFPAIRRLFPPLRERYWVSQALLALSLGCILSNLKELRSKITRSRIVHAR